MSKSHNCSQMMEPYLFTVPCLAHELHMSVKYQTHRGGGLLWVESFRVLTVSLQCNMSGSYSGRIHLTHKGSLLQVQQFFFKLLTSPHMLNLHVTGVRRGWYCSHERLFLNMHYHHTTSTQDHEPKG